MRMYSTHLIIISSRPIGAAAAASANEIAPVWGERAHTDQWRARTEPQSPVGLERGEMSSSTGHAAAAAAAAQWAHQHQHQQHHVHQHHQLHPHHVHHMHQQHQQLHAEYNGADLR